MPRVQGVSRQTLPSQVRRLHDIPEAERPRTGPAQRTGLLIKIDTSISPYILLSSKNNIYKKRGLKSVQKKTSKSFLGN